MRPKHIDRQQTTFFSTFEEQLNPKHPLYQLAQKIDWQLFEDAFMPLYSSKKGRPAKPIRRMVGLLILKHVRNVSDESVVEQWSENAYYQHFCGEQSFTTAAPCNSSELVHFRHRIGEQGFELILKESIRVNHEGDDSDDKDNRLAFIDTTVQEKNITYPTDAKLHRKIIEKCRKIAKDEGFKLRQTYTRILKELGLEQRFRGNPRNKKRAYRADAKVKTIAWRLVRELERLLGKDSKYADQIELFYRVLAQTRTSKNKVYSLHEPDVECISKGKEHKKYEFGNKVSIIYSIKGVILGALSFRNEYDGHTVEKSLMQSAQLTGYALDKVGADRGYRGRKTYDKTELHIPSTPSPKESRYQRDKKRKFFRKRASIEPIIGHLKNDHRLSRNFYKGLFGDAINVLLAAAAFNFKRAMALLWLYLMGRYDVRLLLRVR